MKRLLIWFSLFRSSFRSSIPLFIRVSTVVVALVIGGASFRARAVENTGREFLMSCTYGVLAGTLVGAASLAFTQKPSENLNIVARGASLGLYTGILLGFYVVYIVPGLESNPDEDPVAQIEKLRFTVVPSFLANNRLDGFHADWTVLKF